MTNNMIVVASGNHAYIYQYNMDHREMVLLNDFASEDVREHIHNLVRDKWGKSWGAGGGRHGMEPQTDPHKKVVRNFAHSVATHINDLCKKGYNKLILISPPNFLGELRSLLHKEATKAVVTTIDKDMTKFNIGKIPEKIEKSLGVKLNFLLLESH